MKTKAKILTAVMVVAALLPLPLSLAGCDTGTQTEPEQPQDQTATIDNLFEDTECSATIEGNLTDTEWAGVADKIRDGLEALFAAADGNIVLQGRYRTTFGREGVTIIVEKNPTEYPNWKTTGDGRTLYINLATVNGAALQSNLEAAVIKMRANAADQAKVILPLTVFA